jgi:hypothetical protein
MAKSSPEKLALALRANLLRRKQSGAAKGPKSAPDSTAKTPEKPAKNSA